MDAFSARARLPALSRSSCTRGVSCGVCEVGFPRPTCLPWVSGSLGSAWSQWVERKGARRWQVLAWSAVALEAPGALSGDWGCSWKPHGEVVHGRHLTPPLLSANRPCKGSPRARAARPRGASTSRERLSSWCSDQTPALPAWEPPFQLLLLLLPTWLSLLGPLPRSLLPGPAESEPIRLPSPSLGSFPGHSGPWGSPYPPRTVAGFLSPLIKRTDFNPT